MLAEETKVLGTFELKHGLMRVTDPCYTKNIWCNGTFKAKNGTWIARVVISDEGSWGKRVKELVIHHIDHQNAHPYIVLQHDADEDTNLPNSPKKRGTDVDVGVDSGQCGFFDDMLYPNDRESTGDYDDKGSFYGLVCSITLSSSQAGVVQDLHRRESVNMGVVSSSGYGDGSYLCYVDRDAEDRVIAAKVVFIEDEEEEDEEEDEEEYWEPEDQDEGDDGSDIERDTP